MADPVGPVDPASRRRALATCLWLAGTVLLCGLDLPAYDDAAFQYAPFGLVGGLLGLLYVFALASRDVVWTARGWLKPLLLVYWVGATAMVFRVLLPPPGLVQAALAFGAALGAAILVSRTDREGAALWLGIVAVGLTVLRFALVPFFDARSGLPNWGPLRLGETADAMRDVFVAYSPQRPAAQALHFAGLVSYAVALWVQWRPPAPEVPPDPVLEPPAA